MEQLTISKDVEQKEEIFAIIEQIKELGYAKISGKYAKVADEIDARLLLAIEEVLAKEEQKKVIERTFVR